MSPFRRPREPHVQRSAVPVPVYLTVGRRKHGRRSKVGTVRTLREMPQLLRAVADELDRSINEQEWHS